MTNDEEMVPSVRINYSLINNMLQIPIASVLW